LGLPQFTKAISLLLEEDNGVSDSLENYPFIFIVGFAVKKLLTWHKCPICASKVIQGDSKVYDETCSFIADKSYEESSLHLSNLTAPSLGVVSFQKDRDSIFLKHYRNSCSQD